MPDLPPLETLKTQLTKHYKVDFWEKGTGTNGDQATHSRGLFKFLCISAVTFKTVKGKMSNWKQESWDQAIESATPSVWQRTWKLAKVCLS